MSNLGNAMKSPNGFNSHHQEPLRKSGTAPSQWGSGSQERSFKGRYTVFLLLYLYLFPLPLYAQISAQVDRQLLTEDETLRLIIHTEGDDKELDPDLSVLNSDFNILGTSQSSQLQIINGNTRSSKQWQITLHPKRTGDLLIPEIPLGTKKTQAIDIKVVGAAQLDPQEQAKRPVFVESQIDKANPYVQEQVILTVRLFHNVPIHNGSLTQPEINNAVVEKIGDDIKGRMEKNGQLYDVIERRYAIFPQKSGQIEIPAIHFEGAISRARQGQQNSFNRGFFSDPFSMMQNTQTLRTRSTPININVKTIPDSFSGQHWLPAHSLRLQEKWTPDTTNFEVGQAVTRTITLIGEGVTASQLPSLDTPDIARISIYPDQSIQENRSNENGILGLTQQKLALLPNEEGMVTLPEVRIPWWNTQTNRYEVATLPAKKITITASSKAQAGLSTNTLPHTEMQLAVGEEQSHEAKTPASQTNVHWSWLTVVFATLWLITLYSWQRERTKNRLPRPTAIQHSKGPTHSLNALQKIFQKHCADNNPSAARTALLQWAQQRWPTKPIRHLGDVIKHCDHSPCAEHIQELDNALYAQSKTWQGNELYQAFTSWLNEQQTQERTKGAHTAQLPELYHNHHNH